MLNVGPQVTETLKGLRDGLTKKTAVLLDFVQMRGGVPCPIFLVPFHKCIFGQEKESILSKMPIFRTLNCFLDCLYIEDYIVIY